MTNYDVRFYNWEAAFTEIEADPDLDLITGLFDGHRYWVLAEHGTNQMVARGHCLHILAGAYGIYKEEQEGD